MLYCLRALCHRTYRLYCIQITPTPIFNFRLLHWYQPTPSNASIVLQMMTDMFLFQALWFWVIENQQLHPDTTSYIEPTYCTPSRIISPISPGSNGGSNYMAPTTWMRSAANHDILAPGSISGELADTLLLLFSYYLMTQKDLQTRVSELKWCDVLFLWCIVFYNLTFRFSGGRYRICSQECQVDLARAWRTDTHPWLLSQVP